MKAPASSARRSQPDSPGAFSGTLTQPTRPSRSAHPHRAGVHTGTAGPVHSRPQHCDSRQAGTGKIGVAAHETGRAVREASASQAARQGSIIVELEVDQLEPNGETLLSSTVQLPEHPDRKVADDKISHSRPCSGTRHCQRHTPLQSCVALQVDRLPPSA